MLRRLTNLSRRSRGRDADSSPLCADNGSPRTARASPGGGGGGGGGAAAGARAEASPPPPGLAGLGGNVSVEQATHLLIQAIIQQDVAAMVATLSFASLEANHAVGSNGRSCRPLLHMAASLGSLECARELLRLGADVDCQDATGTTATHLVSRARAHTWWWKAAGGAWPATGSDAARPWVVRGQFAPLWWSPHTISATARPPDTGVAQRPPQSASAAGARARRQHAAGGLGRVHGGALARQQRARPPPRPPARPRPARRPPGQVRNCRKHMTSTRSRYHLRGSAAAHRPNSNITLRLAVARS